MENLYKKDKYGGWYDEKGVYYNSKGEISLIPKTLPPNPEKFKDRVDLNNGSFKISDGSIYFYDEKGGWYDENFNYYNKNGEPDKSGSDMETSVEEIRKRQIFAGSEQEADDEKEVDYQPDYSMGEEEKDFISQKKEYFEKSSKKMNILKKIDKFHQIISNYDEDKTIRIIISRLPSSILEQEIKDFIKNTLEEKVVVKEISQHAITIHKNNYNNWTLLVDKPSAFICLSLEGKKIANHTIHLNIDTIDFNQKDSSDDEQDMFSSDHFQDGKQSFEFYNFDKKFKSGEEDFKIITEKRKSQDIEEKKIISRNLGTKKNKF